MTKLNQDASPYANTAPYLTITVTSDGTTAVDISNTTIEWVMYDERNTVVLYKATGGSGVTIEDGPNGICKVTLDNEDTKGFNGAYQHYLRITDSNGNSDIVMRGTLTWEKLPEQK